MSVVYVTPMYLMIALKIVQEFGVEMLLLMSVEYAMVIIQVALIVMENYMDMHILMDVIFV